MITHRGRVTESAGWIYSGWAPAARQTRPDPPAATANRSKFFSSPFNIYSYNIRTQFFASHLRDVIICCMVFARYHLLQKRPQDDPARSGLLCLLCTRIRIQTLTKKNLSPGRRPNMTTRFFVDFDQMRIRNCTGQR